MIAYIFPPLATTGVHRTAKFVKYAPRFGWKPYVLTVKNPAYTLTDDTLLKDIPPEAIVTKTLTFETIHAKRAFVRFCELLRIADPRIMDGILWRIDRLFAPLSIPDEHLPWAFTAVVVGYWLIMTKRVDVIFSTSWPYSDHITGLVLKKLTGKPWFVDFRDPWLSNINYKRCPQSIRGRIDRKLEASIIENASKVISVNDEVREDFRSRYPLIPKDRFITIYNGYDEEDLKTVHQPASDASNHAHGLRLVHVGAFYKYRTPEPLLRAIKILEQNGVTNEDIKITFVGNMGEHEGLPCRMGLEMYVESLGHLPLKNALRHLRSADVLVIIDHENETKNIPGKVFEYLASGKYILGIVPDSPCALLLRKAGGTTVIHPSDVLKIADTLNLLLKMKRSGKLKVDRDHEFVKQFSRKNLTSQLCRIFNSST